MAAERERPVREGQAKKAILTAELARIEASRGQLGTSISLGHYLNVKDQLRQLKREITHNKGLTSADVLAVRRDPEPEEEDQTQPLVEWGKTAGPAFLKFLRNGAIALDDSAGVHTDEERRAAVDSLPSSFRGGVTQPVLSAPTAAMRQGSTSISRGLGNGPVHPEIYDQDPASRISNNVGSYAPYLIPLVGPALAATQTADMGSQILIDPRKAASDFYDGAAPWKAKTPEDMVLRSIGLAATVAGVAKATKTDQAVGKAVRSLQDKIPKRKGKIMQKSAGPLVPELRVGDTSEVPWQRTYPYVGPNPVVAIRYLVDKALSSNSYKGGFVIDRMDQKWRDRVLADTGVKFDNSDLVLTADSIRHSHKKHGDPVSEASRNQVAIKRGHWVQMARIVRDYDHAVAGDTPGTVLLTKRIGRDRVVVIAQTGVKKNKLFIKTTWAKQ
jgi:hypothetical protein